MKLFDGLFGNRECVDCKRLREQLKKAKTHHNEIHWARLKAMDEIEARFQRREKELRYRENSANQSDTLLERYRDNLYHASQNVAQLREEKKTLRFQIKSALVALDEGNCDQAREILLAKAKKRRRSKKAKKKYYDDFSF